MKAKTNVASRDCMISIASRSNRRYASTFSRGAVIVADLPPRRRRLTQWGVPDCDAEGRPVCRWCRSVLTLKRRTFCGNPACLHEWKVRSDAGYVRQRIWKRDRGICQRCLVNVARSKVDWLKRRRTVKGAASRRAWLKANPQPRWEADHLVAVADGGGDCGLANYRLLCRACHVAVTAAWRTRRAGARRVG
jgi:hypothetical protein